MNRFQSRKFRQSTKDRFVSVLRGDPDPNNKHTPWFKRRTNFFPLLMIMVFSFLYMASKVYVSVRAELGQETEESMAYEEAQAIFNSSGAIPDKQNKDTTN